MLPTDTMTLLGLCGSLRRASVNATLLRALATIAPPGVAVTVHEGLGELPLFNPDRESDPPEAVRTYWSALASCDGVIIASPEYAHGYTAVIKNALDWVVGRGSLVNKPVAVLNAAPRSRVAVTTLEEVLRTIDACLVEEASMDIPILGRALDVSGLVADVEIRSRLDAVLAALRASRSACAVTVDQGEIPV